MNQCKHCQVILTENNTYPSDWKSGARICKNCRKSDYKQNVSSEKESIYMTIKSLTLKDLIIKNYNGKCFCCGENIWQFLTIDHEGNWGNKHRKEVIGNRGGKAIYQWLKNNNFPKDNFRLLCFNCNCSIGFHGFCSHQMLDNNEICIICKAPLTNYNWNEFHKINNICICQFCCLDKSMTRKNASSKINKNGNLQQRRLINKKYTLSIRLQLIIGYGGKCECCEENNSMFLSIDHINNDGFLDKKKFKNNMNAFYNHLIDNNFPRNNYRLLCYNCNCCRGAFGKCYHELCREINKDNISISEYKDIILNENKYG